VRNLIIILTSIMFACTVPPLQHTITNADAECSVLVACQTMWHAADQGGQAVCMCQDNYKNMTMECQAAFQDMAACLHQRACSLMDCAYSIPIEQLEECDFGI
jgi:hypothetical protein